MRIDLSNKNPDSWDQVIVLESNNASSLFEELRLEGSLRGEFQVFPQGSESYLVHGSVQGTQILTCVRTLETFSHPFDLELSIDVKRSSQVATQEMEDDDGDTYLVRIPALQESVDITECVRQLVILQEPMNPVKDPSGDFVWKDPGAEPEESVSDPRWEKLKALKAKFENPNG